MIKRYLALLFCGLICFQLAACGGNKADDDSAEEKCKHKYSEVISEATYGAEGEIKKTCDLCGDEITEVIPKLASPIELTVTDMETIKKETEPMILPDGYEIGGLPKYYIIFEMDVKNLSEKAIESFSGKLEIADGEQQLSVFGTFEERIGAGETVYLSDYGVEVDYSNYITTGSILMNKEPENLNIEFLLEEIK